MGNMCSASKSKSQKNPLPYPPSSHHSNPIEENKAASVERYQENTFEASNRHHFPLLSAMEDRSKRISKAMGSLRRSELERVVDFVERHSSGELYQGLRYAKMKYSPKDPKPPSHGVDRYFDRLRSVHLYPGMDQRQFEEALDKRRILDAVKWLRSEEGQLFRRRVVR